MFSFIKKIFIILLIFSLVSILLFFPKNINVNFLVPDSESFDSGNFDSEATESIGSEPSSPDSSDESLLVFSDKIYFSFGDSITYGADFTRQYAQMDDPYPELVAESLKLRNYTNFAVSGSCITVGVDGLPSIYEQCCNASPGADIVSLMGGVNDYNRNVPLGDISDISATTFYGSLNLCCETLLNKYPDAFVFFMTPYKEDCYHESSCTEKNLVGYNLEDYANAIKEVAAKYDIPVLDMYNEGQFELEMYNENSDGIHPSQEFIREYTAPQIAEFIRQNYRGK